MSKLKPLFARVLLKREKLEKVGSILVPTDAQKRHASLRCTVVATGPTCDPTIKPGMVVIIGKYAGEWFDSDGKANPEGEWYIAQDEDLIAEVTDD